MESIQPTQSIQTSNQIFQFKCKPLFEKYYSDDSAYGVYSFGTFTELPNTRGYERFNEETKELGTEYQSTLVGKMQKLNIGTSYDVKAKLVFSKKYKSYNYELISISQDVPQSLDDQRTFLRSIVTENQANVLLEQYPNIVQDVIDGKDNIDLSKTKGIKEFTWNLIKSKIAENYVMADILVLLIPLGVTINKVRKLFDNEPNTALLKQKLLNDPYVLTELDGFGFKTADRFALKLNPDFLVSKERTVAFLREHLKEVGDSAGHTWIYKNELDTAVTENVVECIDHYEAIVKEQKEMSTFLYIEGEGEYQKVGFRYYRDTEWKIWDKINEINESEPLEISEEEIENGIRNAEEKQGFEFTIEQREVLHKATENNLVILTGKAGTGKTTIARGLLNIYSQKYMVAACALSAKAARRIKEVTGYPATTAHRMLGATGPYQFTYNEYNRLPFDLVFIDENSMIFSGLFWNIIRALKPGAKLIMCGDSGQIPPIGWGNPFFDYLKKDSLQIFYLTKILRQAEKSGIISSSNLIREGIDPLNGEKHIKTVYGEDQNMYFLFRSAREDLNSIAIKTYLKTIEDPEIGIENCCILSSRKDGCLNSSRKINDVIQDALLDKNLPTMKYGESKTFRLGARVMQVINSYEKNVFNGDLGKIINIGYDGDGNEFMEVEYPEVGNIIYYKSDLNELELGYAYSVHKSQGSEYHTVIVIIDNNGWLLLDNGLLYTALTRGKTRCLLLAEPTAYDRCLQISKSNSRNTWTQSFEYKKEE